MKSRNTYVLSREGFVPQQQPGITTSAQFSDGLDGNSSITGNMNRTSYNNGSARNSCSSNNSSSGIYSTEDNIKVEIDNDEQHQSLLAEFSENTTAHGFKNVFSDERGKPLRIAWAIAILGSFIFLCYVLFDLYLQYEDHPFITVTNVEKKSEMNFPAVTLCNINEFDFRKGNALPIPYGSLKLIDFSYRFALFEQQQRRNNASIHDRPLPRYLRPYEDLFNMTYYEIAEATHNTLEETVVSCSFAGEHLPCKELFAPYWTMWGKCFQFNFDHLNVRTFHGLGPAKGLRLFVDLNQEGSRVDMSNPASFILIVHEPGTYPDLRNKGYLFAPGAFIFARIKATEYDLLPEPFKSFGNDYCLEDVSEALQTKDWNPVYTYGGCVNHCVLQWAMDTCGCIMVPVNNTEKDYPFCTLWQVLTCFRPAIYNASDNKTITTRTCGHCRNTCDTTKYELSVSSGLFPSETTEKFMRQKKLIRDVVSVRANYLQLRLFFDEMVLHQVKYEPKFSFASIAGTVGGQMGLCIGASVLTLCEIVDCLAVVCLRHWRRRRRNRKTAKSSAATGDDGSGIGKITPTEHHGIAHIA